MLKRLERDMPQLRRELHTKIGMEGKRILNAAIDNSGLNDSHSKIKRWQVVRVGSGGGYTAISAAKADESGGTGRDSAGAITNYLEHGHPLYLVRGKNGTRKKKYIRRVRGFAFYQSASVPFQNRAIGAVNQLVKQIADQMEAGG